MAKAQNKKWALDTNVFFDLAKGLDGSHSLREIAGERGYTLHITPTPLRELAHKSVRGSPEEKRLASSALENLGGWSISPLPLPQSADAIAEEFSKFLRSRGVLPYEEVNDGTILAEASLGDASLLISSDPHLFCIDPDELRLAFEDRGLSPIPITTPRRLLRILQNK